MYNLTDKGINILISAIEQQPNKYFWIRSADFTEQIYVSENFKSVWGQENSKLFEHPMAFVDALVDEDNADITKQFETRAKGTQEEKEGTLLARINADNNSTVHWRDSCFCICDTYGNIIGAAGVGEVVQPSEWYKDLEGDVNEPSPLELLKKSQHARYIVSEKPDSVQHHNVEIPCKRINGHYYVQTLIGEIALTRREIECVYCLFAGMTAKQTGKYLKISNRTVEDFIRNVRRKLGCKNKLEFSKLIIHIVK